MAKIQSEMVVDAALQLLQETGLDGLSTRRLAQSLGVESATLYWHFRNKSALLASMASAVLARHHLIDVPQDTQEWEDWFASNARSFRRALLHYRDGARLHAGSTPAEEDRPQLELKVAYLVRSGFTAIEAGMALFAAGQYTIGCVLEEQAYAGGKSSSDSAVSGPDSASTRLAFEEHFDAEAAFEFGLGLLLDGLRYRSQRNFVNKR